MSNITIVERAADLAALPPDILLTRLQTFSKDALFTGQYAGPGRGDIEESFERNLGPKSPSKLPRGVNNLWTKGGLMYAPPIR